ncbi:MAG: hypothetical protein ABIZ81_05540 [Opitutaceae bacterium]
MPTPRIAFVAVSNLRHIEGFSPRRVAWLAKKIATEGIWRVPLVLERKHHLAMDGQHRMEVARKLGLAVIPALLYGYDEVEVWSLRPRQYSVSGDEIIARALSGDIYPYKTAKHRFPCGDLPELAIPLADLFDQSLAGRSLPRAA